MRGEFLYLLIATMALGCFASASADVVIIGGLGNFDVRNRENEECCEFDIELEGPHPEDVTHTYHNWNYGAPTITPLPGDIGIRVVYAHPQHATAPNAIEHFGVTVSAAHPVTVQRFNWVLGGLNPPYPPPPPPPPPPPLAMPLITTEIYYVPGGWMMRETLTNVDPLQRLVWVVRKETGSVGEVALEDLMVDNPLILAAVPIDTEPHRLDVGVPLVFEEDAPAPGELRSEVLVYEVYANQRVWMDGEWTDVPGPLFTTAMSAAVAEGATCPAQYLPSITLQPQNEMALLDGAVFFYAEGVDPYGGEVFYQWRHEGVDLAGCHDSFLDIDPVGPEHAGAYTCTISNDCGFVRTDAAYLTVVSPCTFLVQPQDTMANQGETATFTVTVQAPQQEFFWRQRGAEIPPGTPRFDVTISTDQRSSTLTISNVRASDGGRYDLALAGDCEFVISNVAVLNVPIVLGDLNCNGVADFDDINPFVLALSDPAEYATTYPDCTIVTGDCDGDGDVDFDDISAFVALLGG